MHCTFKNVTSLMSILYTKQSMCETLDILPRHVWLVIREYIDGETYATDCKSMPLSIAFLLVMRQLNQTWCECIRDIVRTQLIKPPRIQTPPFRFRGNSLWSLAKWNLHACQSDIEEVCMNVWRLNASLPRTNPSFIRNMRVCRACGHYVDNSQTVAQVMNVSVSWNTFVIRPLQKIKAITETSTIIPFCSACRYRCTWSAKRAIRTLMACAVDEYDIRMQAPDYVQEIPTCSSLQKLVALFDDQFRYFKSDVKMLGSHPRWGSPFVERLDFTTHKSALVWTMSPTELNSIE